MSTVLWNDETRQIEVTDPVDYTATPVVDAASLRGWLRLGDDTSEDDVLLMLQAVACEMIESLTWRRLLPTGLKLWLDWMPQSGPMPALASRGINEPYQSDCAIVLASGPLLTFTKFEYYLRDDGDTATELDASYYRVDGNGPNWKARVYSADAYPGWCVWTDVIGADLRASSSVALSYQAGYADVASIPAQLKHAIYLITAHLYENRGDCGDPAGCAKACGVEKILGQYRLSQA